MKIILLSGGSGIRLWPLSSDRHPKQLLKLLSDERGRPVSMLQRVWRQLERRGLERSAVIAAAAGQKDAIAAQLGEGIELILEPEKRDTFPAVLLAGAYLSSRRGLLRDEPVLVMPVDSMADETFFDHVFRLPDVLEQTGAKVALMGIRPKYPSEKFGYLIPADEPLTSGQGLIAIAGFREKPSGRQALELIGQGALWNGGVFCFRAGYLWNLLERQGLPASYEELLPRFAELAAQSFDYAVAEGETDMAALVYDGEWKDIGTWCSLTEAMREPLLGHGVLAGDCRNVHVVNVTETPVIALGVQDVIVAVGAEGILVSSKQASEGLKDALRLLPDRSTAPRDEGIDSFVLDRSRLDDGTTITTAKVRLEPGTALSHAQPAGGPRQAVAWTVVRGAGRLEKNGAAGPLCAGETAALEGTDTGRLFAPERLELIEVCTVYG